MSSFTRPAKSYPSAFLLSSTDLKRRQWSKDYVRHLTALIPLSAFLFNSFLLINLLHYSTLPSLKIWSWPNTFLKENAEYASWFTPEIVLQIVTLLASLYLFTAIVVSVLGFIGVLRKHASTIRFFKDCAIADLSFCIALTLFMGYGAFFYQQLGFGVTACEELARNPVIMRSLGIDPETCEQWVERSLLASIICMVVLVVVRLHATLLISKYYKHIAGIEAERHLPLNLSDLAHSSGEEDRKIHHRHQSSSHKVFLLASAPTASSSSSISTSVSVPVRSAEETVDDEMITVYSPTAISINAAKKLSSGELREAWVGSNPGKRHRHRHHRKNSSRNSVYAKEDTWVDSAEEDEGTIALPTSSGEGLHRI